MGETKEKGGLRNEKLGMAQMQGRFVNLDELSQDEIERMLEEARKNEKMIREQINELLLSGRTSKSI